MKNKLPVSVILPTYNEKHNVRQMISMLLHYLENYNAEIIVSDDNSPDGTWKIVQQISKKNKISHALRR